MIEVVARCGDWLQVATTPAEEDESWIMWQTDSWTLLVELGDQKSETCTSVSDIGNEDVDMTGSDSMSTTLECPSATPNGASTRDEDMESRDEHFHKNNTMGGEETMDSESGEAGASDDTSDILEGLCEDMASNDLSASSAEVMVCASADCDTSTPGDGVVWNDQASPSSKVEDVRDPSAEDASNWRWDERPLNTSRREGTGEIGDSGSGQDDEQQPTRYPSPVEDGNENQPVAHVNDLLSESVATVEIDQAHSTISGQGQSSSRGDEQVAYAAVSWDDRPVRPQKGLAGKQDEWDDDAQSSQIADSQREYTAADSELPVENAESHVSQLGDTPPHSSVQETSDAFSQVKSGSDVLGWDETPVGSHRSWDERPIRPQKQPFEFEEDGSEAFDSPDIDDPPDDADAELCTELAPCEPVNEHPGESGALSWDETPVGCSHQSSRESPIGSHSEDIEGEDGRSVKHLSIDSATNAADGDCDQVQPRESFSSWDETPVGSTHRSQGISERVDSAEVEDEFCKHSQPSEHVSSWDETPVGPSSQSGEMPVASPLHAVEVEGIGSGTSHGPTRDDDPKEAEDELLERDILQEHVWDETPVGPNPRLLGEELVGSQSQLPDDENEESELYAETMSEHQRDVQTDQVLAHEPTPTWDAAPVGSNGSSWDETPVGSSNRAWEDIRMGSQSSDVEAGEEENAENVSGASEGELDELSDQTIPSQPTPSWDGVPSGKDLRSYDELPVGSRHEALYEEPVGVQTPSMEIDDSEIAVNEEAMIVDEIEDGADELCDHILPSPVRDETLDGAIQRPREESRASPTNQNVESHRAIIEADAAMMRADVPDEVQDQLNDMEHMRRGNEEVCVGKVKTLAENTSGLPRRIIYEHRFGMAELSRSERQSGGLSFLLEFGIRAYCRHKQILITSNDEISQILFEAVVFGDDPEVTFEALVAGDPPSQDWIAYTPPTVLPRASEADPHSFLDVLYARDPGETPSTPKRMPSLHAHQLHTPPHSSGARKEKMDRMFKRTPVTQRATPTYDLIMNDADVDKILEAEFGNEVCELDILGPYKYPTLSGRRLPGTAARSAMSDYGAVSSSSNRLLSASQPVGVAVAESRPVVASAFQERNSEEERESSQPPAVANANPLKRAASAIAKTPPVRIAKAASASPAVPPVAERAKVSSTLLPPTSRFGSKPPSMPSAGASSSLRRLLSQPSGAAASSGSVLEPAAPRARRSQSLLSEPNAATSRASMTGALPKPAQSLLQRKSFLPAPSPSKSVTQAVNRSSIAGSIAQATDTSSLQARRASFGFVRPKTVIPKK